MLTADWVKVIELNYTVLLHCPKRQSSEYITNFHMELGIQNENVFMKQFFSFQCPLTFARTIWCATELSAAFILMPKEFLDQFLQVQ